MPEEFLRHMIFSVDKQIQRAKMPPRKEEFPPFMRFMIKEISEFRIITPNTKPYKIYVPILYHRYNCRFRQISEVLR